MFHTRNDSESGRSPHSTSERKCVGHVPAAQLELGPEMGREDPGHVLEQPAAGDVGQRRAARSRPPAISSTCGDVGLMGREQPVEHLGGRFVILEQQPDQRVAVGVRAPAGEADEQVALAEIVGAGPERVPVDDADDGAGDVDRAGHVDAGHLGRLAAEQRTPDGLAGLGHAGHDLGDDLGHERRGGDVVEEEERPGALHEDVVDAVVDEVGTDAPPASVTGGELDLRAHAVGRCDEHLARTEVVGREEAAEGADLGQHRRRVGRLDHVGQQSDGAIAGVDVDARALGRWSSVHLGGRSGDVGTMLRTGEVDQRDAGVGGIGRRRRGSPVPR